MTDQAASSLPRDPIVVIAAALGDLADAAGRGEYPGEAGAARYIVDRLRAEYGSGLVALLDADGWDVIPVPAGSVPESDIVAKYGDA